MFSLKYTKCVSIEANFLFLFIFVFLKKLVCYKINNFMWNNFTLSSKKILRNVCEITQIIQTVKIKSLYFVYWGLMLVFVLWAYSEWQCVISMRLVHSVWSTEPILQVKWTVQLQWLLVMQTVVRVLHIELQLCPLWVSNRKKM